jgi:hypothetical protein
MQEFAEDATAGGRACAYRPSCGVSAPMNRDVLVKNRRDAVEKYPKM